MNINERLKTTLLWMIRWLIYPPIIYFVLYFIQIYNQGLLANLVWWRAIPIWAFTSVFATIGVTFSGLICPNRKFGNFLFLGLFVFLEVWSFYNEIRLITGLQMILRIWADLCIIAGFIIAGTMKLDADN